MDRGPWSVVRRSSSIVRRRRRRRRLRLRPRPRPSSVVLVLVPVPVLVLALVLAVVVAVAALVFVLLLVLVLGLGLALALVIALGVLVVLVAILVVVVFAVLVVSVVLVVLFVLVVVPVVVVAAAIVVVVGDCGYVVRLCVPRLPNYQRVSRNAIDATVVIGVIERPDYECDYVNEYGYRIAFLMLDSSHGEHSAGYDEYVSCCSRGAHSYWHLGRYHQEGGL